MTAKAPTSQFSGRWDREVIERLERRSRTSGTNKSRLAERYVEEGMRMDDHPGIVFRDGPAGRRAALAGGPDVWEVIASLKQGSERGGAAVEEIADLLALSVPEVRAAVRYYAEFGAEVDERIQLNVEEAEAAEAAWRREQAVLS